MILSTRGRKDLFFSLSLYSLAFRLFLKSFSSYLSRQVIERAWLETIGLHSPTPDLGDTGADHESWYWLFGPITEEFFFRGAISRGLNGMARFKPHCHDGYLV